jgi:hypothetical protein
MDLKKPEFLLNQSRSQAKSIIKRKWMLIKVISARYSEIFFGPILSYWTKKILSENRSSYPNGQELNVVNQCIIFILGLSIIYQQFHKIQINIWGKKSFLNSACLLRLKS